MGVLLPHRVRAPWVLAPQGPPWGWEHGTWLPGSAEYAASSVPKPPQGLCRRLPCSHLHLCHALPQFTRREGSYLSSHLQGMLSGLELGTSPNSAGAWTEPELSQGQLRVLSYELAAAKSPACPQEMFVLGSLAGRGPW